MASPFIEDPERDERLALLRELLAESTLKGRRKELGYSQRGLGQETDVPQTTIHRVEAGATVLTEEVAGRLAVALKMDASELAIRENVALLRRMANAGRLDPDTAAGVALKVMQAQPTSPSATVVRDALVGALTEITELAAVTKTRVRRRQGTRNGFGIEMAKPTDAGRA